MYELSSACFNLYDSLKVDSKFNIAVQMALVNYESFTQLINYHDVWPRIE